MLEIPEKFFLQNLIRSSIFNVYHHGKLRKLSLFIFRHVDIYQWEVGFFKINELKTVKYISPTKSIRRENLRHSLLLLS